MNKTLDLKEITAIMFDKDEIFWASSSNYTQEFCGTSNELDKAYVQWCTNPLKQREPQMKEDGSGKYKLSKTNNNVRLCSLYVESDDLSRQDQEELVKTHRELFTLVVDSQNKSLHSFIRLNKELDYTTWEKYQRKLKILMKGCTASVNPSRSMRMPFGLRKLNGVILTQNPRLFNTRKDFGFIKDYLDKHVTDDQYYNDIKSKIELEDGYITDNTVTDHRKKEILQAMKMDHRIKNYLDIESTKGFEEGEAVSLCFYLHSQLCFTPEEMVFLFNNTQKMLKRKGRKDWPSDTVTIAMKTITEAQKEIEDEEDEGKVTYKDFIISALLNSRNNEITRYDLLKRLRDTFRIQQSVAQSVLNRLLRKNEIHQRERSGTKVLALQASTKMYNEQEFKTHLERTMERDKKENRIKADIHPRLNELTGGFVRGEMFLYIAETNDGKSYYTGAVAATALEAGYKVLLISSEATYSQYVKRVDRKLKSLNSDKNFVDYAINNAPRTLFCLKYHGCIDAEDILLAVNECGADLVIIDYIQANMVNTGFRDKSNDIKPVLSRLHSELCSDEKYNAKKGKAPAVVGILQKKVGEKDPYAQYPLPKVYGDTGAGYAKHPTTIVSCMKSTPIHVGTDDWTFINEMIVSKSKIDDDNAIFVDGYKYTTYVKVKENNVTDFSEGWPSDSEQWSEIDKILIGE